MAEDTPSPSVLSSHLGPESVLLDLKGQQYFRLNDTGQAIWRALEAGMTRPAIIAELMQTFDVDETNAGAEVDRFIKELAAAGLLRGREET